MSFCVARVAPDAAATGSAVARSTTAANRQSYWTLRDSSDQLEVDPRAFASGAAAALTSPRTPRYVFVPPVMTIVNPSLEVDRPGGHERAPGLELVVRLAEGVLVIVEVAGVHARARMSLQCRVAVQVHGIDGDVTCERPVPAAGALWRQLVGRAVERVVDVPARRSSAVLMYCSPVATLYTVNTRLVATRYRSRRHPKPTPTQRPTRRRRRGTPPRGPGGLPRDLGETSQPRSGARTWLSLRLLIGVKDDCLPPRAGSRRAPGRSEPGVPVTRRGRRPPPRRPDGRCPGAALRLRPRARPGDRRAAVVTAGQTPSSP